jgi:cytoskeleton protein RodZ
VVSDSQDKGELSSGEKSSGVGTLLREAREKRGQKIGFVASALRIRQPYLEAIEDGRFHDLPGSAYAVGFVRGYAEYLGLDSKEIIRRFHQEHGEFGSRAELVFPSAVSEGSMPTGVLLGFALIAAALAYGAWYWYQSSDNTGAQMVSPLPERLAALINRPVGSGSELVSVGQKDQGKTGDLSSQSAGAGLPPSSGNAPGGQRDEIVPPTEEDTGVSTQQPAAASAPAASPSQAPATQPPVSAPPTPAAPAIVPSVSQSQDTKAKDAKVAARETSSKPAEPPADAAVTPEAPADIKPDDAKPVKETKGKGKDAKKDASVQPSGGSAPPAGPGGADGGSTPVASAAGDAQSQSAGQAAASGPASVSGSSSRIVLRAQQDCWIEIRDAHGKVVTTRTLRKGDVYSVPRRPGMTMTAGNAGALAVSIDGKEAGPLGHLGMVRRAVPLDADRMKETGDASAESAGPAPSQASPAGGGDPSAPAEPPRDE